MSPFNCAQNTRFICSVTKADISYQLKYGYRALKILFISLRGGFIYGVVFTCFIRDTRITSALFEKRREKVRFVICLLNHVYLFIIIFWCSPKELNFFYTLIKLVNFMWLNKQLKRFLL